MKKGFSLIEVMIAAAISSVLIAAIIRIMDQQNSASITAQTRFDENELLTIFERTIMSERSCNHTLGGWCSQGGTYVTMDRPECIANGFIWKVGVTLGDHLSTNSINDIKDINRNSILSTDTNYGRVKLKSITISTVDTASGGAPIDGVGHVKMDVTTERTNSKFIGAQTFTKSIMAYVKRDPDGSIYKCYTAGFEDVIPSERVYIKIQQTVTTTITTGGQTTGYKYTAECDTGDMLLNGDCILNSSGPGQDLVLGDGNLSITGTPSCDGCPNGTPCDPACFKNSYTGYSCTFNHREEYVIKYADGTEHVVDTAEVTVPANAKIFKRFTPFYTINGMPFANMGARALCLDRY